MSFFLGLDLGQVSDYTALAIIEKVKPPTPVASTTGNRKAVAADERSAKDRFLLRHLERLRLGTPYPDVARHVTDLLKTPELAGKTQCVVDATGVGRPVVDMLREARVKPLVAVTITGGDTATRDGSGYRVPKRDLVSTLQVVLQNDRLKIARDLPLAEVLVREMQNFRVKISLSTGHDSYEAWREGDHDDLVLAVALACWYGAKMYGGSHSIATSGHRPIYDRLHGFN